jgi:hypothetical protein
MITTPLMSECLFRIHDTIYPLAIEVLEEEYGEKTLKLMYLLGFIEVRHNFDTALTKEGVNAYLESISMGPTNPAVTAAMDKTPNPTANARTLPRGCYSGQARVARMIKSSLQLGVGYNDLSAKQREHLAELAYHISHAVNGLPTTIFGDNFLCK